MSLSLLVMAAIMFACIVAWGIAHLLEGTISFIGFCVVMFFAYLVYHLVRLSWVDNQHNKNI